MKQVTLQPGDYVSTEDMAEELYHDVAWAFMNAGARRGEYPDAIYLKQYAAIGWVTLYDAVWHQEIKYFERMSGRQLTIHQVLNATNAGKEADMKNWKPEVGEVAQSSVGQCEVLAVDDRHGKSAIRWPDGHLDVVDTYILKPPMAEEDKAVEEMALEIVGADNDAEYSDTALRALYRAGYCKQPTEDMTDPKNWRAADCLECVADREDLTAGRFYRVIRMNRYNHPVIDDDVGDHTARISRNFRFHSRP